MQYPQLDPPPLYNGEGVEFSKFSQKGGTDFSHKNGGISKIEMRGGVKKGGGYPITYFHTN